MHHLKQRVYDLLNRGDDVLIRAHHVVITVPAPVGGKILCLRGAALLTVFCFEWEEGFTLARSISPWYFSLSSE